MEERFKDCPKCKHRESMIISIKGWLCLWCLEVEKFSEKEEESLSEPKQLKEDDSFYF